MSYMSFLFDIQSAGNISRYRNKLITSRKRKNPEKEKGKKKYKGEPAHVNRSGLFYKHNTINKTTGEVIMGLPPQHVLQSEENDDNKFARKYLRLVFPQEFTNKNRRYKFNKRYSGLCDSMVKKLQKQHNRVQFLPLLERLCSTNDAIVQLTQAASTHNQVYQFVLEVVKRTFPQQFWGSVHNYESICKVIKKYVSRGKGEKISARETLLGFKRSDCQWLVKSTVTNITRNENQKIDSMLSQLMTWFFNGYLCPLVSSFFHVTTHADFGKQPLYFRKDVWQRFTRTQTNKMITNGYYRKVSDSIPD